MPSVSLLSCIAFRTFGMTCRLKIFIQSNPQWQLASVVDEIEEYLKSTFSMSTIKYSSAFGFLYSHMLEKEKQGNKSIEVITCILRLCIGRRKQEVYPMFAPISIDRS